MTAPTVDAYTKAMSHALNMLAAPINDDDADASEDVSTVMTWVREAIKHHAADAYPECSARFTVSDELRSMGVPWTIADVMAALAIEHAATVAKLSEAESKLTRVEMLSDGACHDEMIFNWSIREALGKED